MREARLETTINGVRVRTHCRFPSDKDYEVVERKGLGHPDTLADALAEEISIAYSRHCLQRFGAVLHHNVDKLAISGGYFRADLGVFEFHRPITVILNGRMSTEFGGDAIDIAAIGETTACRVLSERLPRLDAERHVRFLHLTTNFSKYDTWFKPRGLADLPELENPTASDTMVATAWWPLTPLESLVLELERYVDDIRRSASPCLFGEDVKILAVRDRDSVDVVMSVPVLAESVCSPGEYNSAVHDLQSKLNAQAGKRLGDNYNIRVLLNASAANPYSPKRFYVLGIGSCIECGEEGVVGRGNDALGLIAVHRPRSMEAPFGKNPVYHAGKVYACFAREIAREVTSKVGCRTSVTIAARHSDPLRRPWRVTIDVDTKGDVIKEVSSIVHAVLESWNYLDAIVRRRYLVPSIPETPL